MKDATIKLWQSFMENVIGPLVQNEKRVLALFIIALGGGLYTVLDFFGLTHRPHAPGETFEEHARLPLPDRPLFLAPEEAPVAATVDDLPYADHDHDKYSLRKHAHGEYALHTHGHEQKDWTPIIKQAIRESAEELYDKYHK